MKQQWIEELKQILPKEQILPEEAMKQHTTFRIGGPAECLVLPNREQLAKVLLFAKDKFQSPSSEMEAICLSQMKAFQELSLK